MGRVGEYGVWVGGWGGGLGAWGDVWGVGDGGRPLEICTAAGDIYTRIGVQARYHHWGLHLRSDGKFFNLL